MARSVRLRRQQAGAARELCSTNFKLAHGDAEVLPTNIGSSYPKSPYTLWRLILVAAISLMTLGAVMALVHPVDGLAASGLVMWCRLTHGFLACQPGGVVGGLCDGSGLYGGPDVCDEYGGHLGSPYDASAWTGLAANTALRSRRASSSE